MFFVESEEKWKNQIDGDADNRTKLERNHGCLGTTEKKKGGRRFCGSYQKYQCEEVCVLRTFKVQSLK